MGFPSCFNNTQFSDICLNIERNLHGEEFFFRVCFSCHVLICKFSKFLNRPPVLQVAIMVVCVADDDRKIDGCVKPDAVDGSIDPSCSMS